MRIVLDAGALIALERRPKAFLSQLREFALNGALVPLIPATVVAQVWRSGTGRQAPLAALLAQSEISPLDTTTARAVGQLLASAGTDDIVDAHVVVTAEPGDLVVTSDPHDIARLAHTAGKPIGIVTI